MLSNTFIEILNLLEQSISQSTFFVTNELTITDICIFVYLNFYFLNGKNEVDQQKFVSVFRWMNFFQKQLCFKDFILNKKEIKGLTFSFNLLKIKDVSKITQFIFKPLEIEEKEEKKPKQENEKPKQEKEKPKEEKKKIDEKNKVKQTIDKKIEIENENKKIEKK
jgi:outer membrane biosynthesis protein TonB